jgi:hypothetical protein
MKAYLVNSELIQPCFKNPQYKVEILFQTKDGCFRMRKIFDFSPSVSRSLKVKQPFLFWNQTQAEMVLPMEFTDWREKCVRTARAKSVEIVSAIRKLSIQSLGKDVNELTRIASAQSKDAKAFSRFYPNAAEKLSEAKARYERVKNGGLLPFSTPFNHTIRQIIFA